MKIQSIQQRLREARERTGGRYSLTINEEGDEQREAYCTHWFRNDPFSFEDCIAVGMGPIADVVEALDEYAANPPPRRRSMVAADIGLIPVRPTHPMAAE